ncbi:MAG: DnaJ domain-containing protein [Myxococcota bacterium]
MTIPAKIRAAADRLGVEPTTDEKTLRRAYRRAVRRNPPDTEPAAFRSIRDAYELLADPMDQVYQLIVVGKPHLPPPPLPLPPRGHAAALVLRQLARELSVERLRDGCTDD